MEKLTNNAGDMTAEALADILARRRALEYLILAELIAEPSLIDKAGAVLRGDMFVAEGMREGWEALRAKAEAGERIDLMTMTGRVPLKVLTEGSVNAAYSNTERDIMAHVATLVELVTRCALVTTLSDALTQACTGRTPAAEQATAVGARMAALEGEGLPAARVSTIGEELVKYREDLELRRSGHQRDGRITTGMAETDTHFLGGFNAGELIILAARPSVGKTSFMLQLARAAAGANRWATVVSLEMSKRELTQRLLFSTGRMTPAGLASYRLPLEEYDLAADALGMLPINLAEGLTTTDAIVSTARLLHARGRCDILFVDYLGLISPDDPRASLAQDIGNRTRRLKLLAQELGIPVVLLCQLNRRSAGDNREPELTDLRDSGNIEQDADTVIMLARENGDLADHRIQMFVRKYRHGRGNARYDMLADDTFTNFRIDDGYNDPIK